MYEANNTTFKPVDGDLPNTMLRFNLEQVKSKQTTFSDHAHFNVLSLVIVGTFGIAAILMWQQSAEDDKAESQTGILSQRVNQARSQIITELDKPTRAQSEKKRDKARLEAESNILKDYGTQLKTDSSKPTKVRKLSNEEIRLKKLTPDLSAINPDED